MPANPAHVLLTQSNRTMELRALARTCAAAQRAERLLLGALAHLVPRVHSRALDPKRCATSAQWLLSPDFERPLDEWLASAGRDWLELGVACAYVSRPFPGPIPRALEVIDAGSIRPLLDHQGERPHPPYPAYQQIIGGGRTALMTANDLAYVEAPTRAPCPVEALYTRALSALRGGAWGPLMAAGAATYDRMLAAEQAWHARLAGTPVENADLDAWLEWAAAGVFGLSADVLRESRPLTVHEVLGSPAGGALWEAMEDLLSAGVRLALGIADARVRLCWAV